jgi:hypothetical protein
MTPFTAIVPARRAMRPSCSISGMIGYGSSLSPVPSWPTKSRMAMWKNSTDSLALQLISIFVGKIKCGSGGEAYELALFYQVVRRLGVLYMVALYSLLGDYAPYYSFAGVGEIFSPNNSWMNRDSSNKIEDIKKFAGIVAYPLPGLLIIIVKVIA